MCEDSGGEDHFRDNSGPWPQTPLSRHVGLDPVEKVHFPKTAGDPKCLEPKNFQQTLGHLAAKANGPQVAKRESKFDILSRGSISVSPW